MTSEYRRLPAINRQVNKIDSEKDVRVRLTGTVIDSSTGKIVLDDGTGKADIFSEINADVNSVVRVFCRVIPLESGVELRAEIIQDMNSLDIALYNKIFNE